MRKYIAILMLCMVCCAGACSNKTVKEENYVETETSFSEMTSERQTEAEVRETEMDAENKKMIAEALGVDEDSRNIRFILSTLTTIHAGQMQSAEVTENEQEKMIHVVAEDGTKYCLYLSGSGSVDAVQNTDTGEWPIQSRR